MTIRAIFMALALATALWGQKPRVLRVGANQQYKTLASLPKMLQPGDVVEIARGVYPEIKRWVLKNSTSDKPIVIRGVGPGKPIIEGTGFKTARGLFQFEGGSWIVENVEFRYAHNGGNNASGVRNVSASVILKNVKISNCDMGVMSSNGSGDTIIEDSDIGFNGRSALGHNLYLSGARAIVRRNRIHNSLGGQNVKVRSRLAEVSSNYIHDGMDGEVEFVDSPATAKPGSDAVMEGNLVVSRAARPASANCCRFINFGHGGKTEDDRVGTLYLRDNILIARNAQHIFVTLASVNAALVTENNSYLGSKNLLRNRFDSPGITARNDFHSVNAPASAPIRSGAPPPPDGLAVVDGANSIELTWKAVPGAAYYKIYSQRMDSKGKVGPVRLWGATPETGYKDGARLYPGRPQAYTITAVNVDEVESPMSPQVSIVRP
jgi:hypothetical protein